MYLVYSMRISCWLLLQMVIGLNASKQITTTPHISSHSCFIYFSFLLHTILGSIFLDSYNPIFTTKKPCWKSKKSQPLRPDPIDSIGKIYRKVLSDRPTELWPKSSVFSLRKCFKTRCPQEAPHCVTMLRGEDVTVTDCRQLFCCFICTVELRDETLLNPHKRILPSHSWLVSLDEVNSPVWESS